jgi:DNA-directed RNA polymerase specialized sigma24 family protein
MVAFDRLLEWLDGGVDSHGDTYLEMRRQLVSYFEQRNRPMADDLADETLNRIARTLERDGTILTRPPARYCYTVARFVLLEDVRRGYAHLRLRHTMMKSADPSVTGAWRLEPEETVEIQEHRLECLERCLQQLTPDQRTLVMEYHRDSRRQKIVRRREMAERLGITMNALSIRAGRIRTALEAAVESCRGERQAT